MKKTFLLLFGFAIFISACKKDHGGQEGYDFTTAYKNTLSVPVEIQSGRQVKTDKGTDTTIFFKPGTIVKAGETYESTLFICQKNCPNIYYTTFVEALDFTKMIIGDKVKIDTNCVYYNSKFKISTANCGLDPANFFDDKQWIATKDKNGNIIRREYVIDEADLKEAH